jgi:ATP-binding cassette, subfamily B, bacterial MsbA
MDNKTILRNFLPVLQPYRVYLVISMIAMIAVGGFNALQAYMVKPLLDEIFLNRNERLIVLLPLALLLVFFAKGVLYFIYNFLLEKVGQSVIRDLRNRIYAHLHEMSLLFFYQHSTGELISRIINDVSMLQSSVTHALIRMLRDFFSVIGLIGVIFYMDWRLALFAMIFIPLATVPIVIFGRKFRKVSTIYQIKIGEATNHLHETIAGVRIVKAFGREQFEKQRFALKTQSIMNTLMKETRYKSVSNPLIEFLGGIGMAMIIWYGGSQVIQGHSTPGAFMSFLTALILLYEPIKGVSKINSNIQQGMSAAARIFTLLAIKPDIKEASSPIELPSFSRSIVFKDVYFNYEHNPPVIKGLNLRVNRGEVLAVVGPSGSGKTTLTNLIPRFYDISQGELLIDDVNIQQVSFDSLRRQMAIVTQQTILFNDTVRNNIAYGFIDCPEEKIVEAARSAYALDFILELPNGFDTVIGEAGARLSGGQQQRISIARALLKNAPLLILDEATSALDTESEREVQKALENLMLNRTTIIIAHRLSTITNADRIVVLKEGQIAEEGTHAQLLDSKGEYSTLYNLQFADRS